MRKQAISIFALTGLLVLGGVSWLSFGYHLPLGESPWSLFLSVLVLSLTGLGLAFLRILARRHGFARQGLVLSVALAIGVLWALPGLVAPCSHLAAVSAGGAKCDQCCTWWVPAPCSLCSQADYNAGKCLGCCLRYEACNCETPEPHPDPPTPLPPTKTPTSTPTRTPTFTPTATFTPTPTNTATPTPTPLPPTISGTFSCSRWGQNGWCIDRAQLVLSASDPQGFPIVISGNAGHVSISCGASCIVNLPEGNGLAKFTVTSTSGRAASGSLPWKYDASLPDAVVQKDGTVGAGGWYVSAVNVFGTGSDAISGVAAVDVSINNGAWQPATVSLADGIYQVQTRVVDQAGWSALSPVQTVRVDTTQPGLTMAASGTKGGGDYFRSAVMVSLAAEDAGSGVALVEYRLESALQGYGLDWVTGSSVTITADGNHGLEGRVTDEAGNVSLRGMAVHIDTIPPVAAFIMPASESITSGKDMVEMGGDVSDVGSGVAGVELSLDGGKTWQALRLVNEIWRYDWYITPLSNGSYPVIARARDIAGNVQSPGTAVTILVANHPPLVDVQERWNIWESGSVSVRENGGVPVDGVRVTIRDPQGRWPEVGQEYSLRNLPGSITWNRRFGGGTLAPSGEYEVVVEAWDGYGNEASDKGMIVIPFVAGATVTTTPVVTPSLSPTATKIVAPTKVIKPTQVVLPTAAPTIQPTLEPVMEQPGKSLFFWPIWGLLGLILALASAAISDGRPRALAHMKETFSQIMKNQGE